MRCRVRCCVLGVYCVGRMNGVLRCDMVENMRGVGRFLFVVVMPVCRKNEYDNRVFLDFVNKPVFLCYLP